MAPTHTQRGPCRLHRELRAPHGVMVSTPSRRGTPYKTRSSPGSLFKTKLTRRLIKNKCDAMANILKQHALPKPYRINTKKTKDVFNVASSFLLGATTNALGATIKKDGTSAFSFPIPGKPGKGMCTTPVYEQQKPTWMKALASLAHDIVYAADKSFAEGDYIAHFSSMNSPLQYGKKHTDHDDYTYQLAVQFGDFKGCKLRLYDQNDNVIGDFDHSYRVLKFDGRLPHEVVMNNFEGERFTVIFFKSGDRKMSGPAPIFTTPHFVPFFGSATTPQPAIVYDFDSECSSTSISSRDDHLSFQGTKAEEECVQREKTKRMGRKKTKRMDQPDPICDTPAIVGLFPLVDPLDFDFFGDSLADPVVTSPPLL